MNKIIKHANQIDAAMRIIFMTLAFLTGFQLINAGKSCQIFIWPFLASAWCLTGWIYPRRM